MSSARLHLVAPLAAAAGAAAGIVLYAPIADRACSDPTASGLCLLTPFLFHWPLLLTFLGAVAAAGLRGFGGAAVLLAGAAVGSLVLAAVAPYALGDPDGSEIVEAAPVYFVIGGMALLIGYGAGRALAFMAHALARR